MTTLPTFTPAEAGDLLNCAPSDVWALLREGTLPGDRVTGQVDCAAVYALRDARAREVKHDRAVDVKLRDHVGKKRHAVETTPPAPDPLERWIRDTVHTAKGTGLK